MNSMNLLFMQFRVTIVMDIVSFVTLLNTQATTVCPTGCMLYVQESHSAQADSKVEKDYNFTNTSDK